MPVQAQIPAALPSIRLFPWERRVPHFPEGPLGHGRPGPPEANGRHRQAGAGPSERCRSDHGFSGTHHPFEWRARRWRLV